MANQYPNFRYSGPFKSPEQLPALYGQIDLVALFYPEEGEADHFFKVKSLCNANRFYEACYFKKPIVSFSFCEGGKNVLKYDIGLALNGYNQDDALTLISGIKKGDIKLWQDNLLCLPKEVYTFTSEGEQLNSIITNLVKNK